MIVALTVALSLLINANLNNFSANFAKAAHHVVFSFNSEQNSTDCKGLWYRTGGIDRIRTRDRDIEQSEQVVSNSPFWEFINLQMTTALNLVLY